MWQARHPLVILGLILVSGLVIYPQTVNGQDNQEKELLSNKDALEKVDAFAKPDVDSKEANGENKEEGALDGLGANNDPLNLGGNGQAENVNNQDPLDLNSKTNEKDAQDEVASNENNLDLNSKAGEKDAQNEVASNENNLKEAENVDAKQQDQDGNGEDIFNEISKAKSLSVPPVDQTKLADSNNAQDKQNGGDKADNVRVKKEAFDDYSENENKNENGARSEEEKKAPIEKTETGQQETNPGNQFQRPEPPSQINERKSAYLSQGLKPVVEGFNISRSLADVPECQQDIVAIPGCRQLLSSKSPFRKNNLNFIACLTNPDVSQKVSPNEVPRAIKIAKACENIVWKYKVAVTQDPSFIRKVQETCVDDNDRANFESCYSIHASSGVSNSGHILSCIIEHKNDPQDELSPRCHNIITQMEAVVFSDYRLIGEFVTKCQNDIDTLECGRVVDGETSFISQGEVMECLMEKEKELKPSCRKEVFRIAEFQSDDYHLDRRLYLACKRDRMNLCSGVKAGDGRVYECLLKKKQTGEMSGQCKKQLLRRQKLMAANYKVSHGLWKYCSAEIHENDCRKEVERTDEKPVKMAQILLCLEDVVQNDEAKVNAQCQTQMREHRKMMMEDYRISPELLTSCKEDIRTSCMEAEKGGGKMIHCLLQLATKRELKSQSCRQTLIQLIKVAKVGNDWKVDLVLKENCQDVVAAACDVNAGEGAVMNCLQTLAAKKSRDMNKECAATLMEIQYFLARDFTLNPRLYKKCKNDAAKFCGAQEDWHLTKEGSEEDDHAQHVFPCLVRNLYAEPEEETGSNEEPKSELEEECAEAVEKVLERRAISVKLHPEIEETCRFHLINNCADQTGPGEELMCLQKGIDEWEGPCQEAVNKYTKIQARNTRLNQPLMTACQNIVEERCKDEINEKDEGGIMHCLIEYKTEHEGAESRMSRKCTVIVEHWQILSLSDWKFSTKFKRACQKDVKENCDSPKTKQEVLTCLSQIIQEDMMSKAPQKRVSRSCRSELKFNLLQKHSNIKLNPILEDKCRYELDELCEDDRSLDCLKGQKHSDLGKECRHIVFRQERSEVMMNSIDPILNKYCASEIKTHCKGSQPGPNSVLNCLKENKDAVNFDLNCRRVVVRRIIQQMKDFRLNPRLQSACANDLPKFCANVILGDVQEEDFLEGKVIDCLKDQYRNDHNKLSKLCSKEIKNIMRQATIDIRANPKLMTTCPQTIEFCKEQTGFDDRKEDDEGKMEECVKEQFKEKKIGSRGDQESCLREVAKIIEEERMDINTDKVLHDTCGLDLSKFCHDVSSGEGEKISCLRNVLDDTKLKLEPKCETLLVERIKMFKLAVEVMPLDSVSDLLRSVSHSRNSSHFLLVGLCVILVIFLVGILCGRSTRRARMELKTK